MLPHLSNLYVSTPNVTNYTEVSTFVLIYNQAGRQIISLVASIHHSAFIQKFKEEKNREIRVMAEANS
jgi:hypothetical protein